MSGCASAHQITRTEISNLAERLETGDVIFQYTNTRTAKVVEEITSSKVTHVGMVIRVNKKLKVLEASGPVRYTSLKNFIRKSKNGWFIIKKPKKSLSKKQKKSLLALSKKWVGKPYDHKFLWGDKKVYCSELVYKIYEQINIDIGGKQQIGDLVSSSKGHSPSVIKYVKRYFGSFDNIPKNEKVVTPANLRLSDKFLVQYYSTYTIATENYFP